MRKSERGAAKRGGAKHGGPNRGAGTTRVASNAEGAAAPRTSAIAPGTGPLWLRRFVADPGFARFTYALITANALALGLEAMPTFGEPMAGLLDGLFAVSTAWFVIEIALRMIANGRPLADFFRDGWNTFDTLIVVLSLLPLAGGIAIVARLLRVLRLLRLVSGSGLLRGFVERTLPVGNHLLAAVLLLALSIYAFALAGFHLAGGVLAESAPWADLPSALRSTLAWSAPLSPPGLPSSNVAGIAWAVALGAAHLAWAALTLRGLFGARANA